MTWNITNDIENATDAISAFIYIHQMQGVSLHIKIMYCWSGLESHVLDAH